MVTGHQNNPFLQPKSANYWWKMSSPSPATAQWQSSAEAPIWQLNCEAVGGSGWHQATWLAHDPTRTASCRCIFNGEMSDLDLCCEGTLVWSIFSICCGLRGMSVNPLPKLWFYNSNCKVKAERMILQREGQHTKRRTDPIYIVYSLCAFLVADLLQSPWTCEARIALFTRIQT